MTTSKQPKNTTSNPDPPRIARMLKITKIEKKGLRRVLLARQVKIERRRHADWTKRQDPVVTSRDISTGFQDIIHKKLEKSRTSKHSDELVRKALKKMIEEEAVESDGDGSLDEDVSKTLEEEIEE